MLRQFSNGVFLCTKVAEGAINHQTSRYIKYENKESNITDIYDLRSNAC